MAPWTTWMVEARVPSLPSERTGNSTKLFGVRRRLLLSSNSTSATPSPVRSLPPWMMGRLAKALSKPCPVWRSSCTSPVTWLRRTMRTPGAAWSGSGAAAASAGEGLVGDSTGTACCPRSGLAQRAMARNAADTRELFRECVMVLPRLSGQEASALVTSRKACPARRHEYSSAGLSLARTNCLRRVISFGAGGGFLGFLDQVQRCFGFLAAQQLVLLALQAVVVHEESLQLVDELTGQVLELPPVLVGMAQLCDRDQAIVADLLLSIELLALHDADEARWHQAAGKGGDNQEQEVVDGIAIGRESSGQEAKIVGKDHAFGKDFAQGEDPLLGIVAVLVAAGLWGLNDDLKGVLAAWVERDGVGEGTFLLFRHN